MDDKEEGGMKMTAHEMPRSYWRKVAERNGIRAKTFNTRMARGWPPNDAATRPLKSGSGWKASGSTSYEKCRQAGLSEDAISRFRRRHDGAPGMTDEQIIERLHRHHHESTKALAERAGIKWKTLESRLRTGWPLEQALATPPLSSLEDRQRQIAQARKAKGAWKKQG